MALLLNRVTGWLVRHKARIKKIGIGLFLYESFNYVYDYWFYFFAIAHWGSVIGGTIAFLGSIIQNTVMFWMYDRYKNDWLGAYALRELEAKGNKNRFERLAVWIGKANKTLWEKILTAGTFILLLAKVDPLIVAVHFQQQHFKGLKAKDWGILFAAIVVGNAWWIFLMNLIVKAIQFLFHFILFVLGWIFN